jgi:hypothetical protein
MKSLNNIPEEQLDGLIKEAYTRFYKHQEVGVGE